ncbi:unnamed protein product [Closterium sp. NIES-65]|nr:unnamed protein product [Closterium sp. NIES-65]
MQHRLNRLLSSLGPNAPSAGNTSATVCDDKFLASAARPTEDPPMRVVHSSPNAAATRAATHPAIVQLHWVFEDDVGVHLVMDFCDSGDLYDEVVRRGRLPEKESALLFRQIASALAFCHSRGVMHRDMKPENILLHKQGDASNRLTVKLADFGLAIPLLAGETTRGISGSTFYMAPEVLSGEYGHSADVWSLGVLLFTMLSGAVPFLGDDNSDSTEAVLNGRLDFSSPEWATISVEAKGLIRCMLHRDPRRRPTAAKVLSHPWVLLNVFGGRIVRRTVARPLENAADSRENKPNVDARGLQQQHFLPRGMQGRVSLAQLQQQPAVAVLGDSLCLDQEQQRTTQDACQGHLHALVAMLEMDLSTVFEAMREKEEELAEAEQRLLFDRDNLETARELIQEREARLAENQTSQLSLREDAEKIRSKLAEQTEELVAARKEVDLRNKEIREAKEGLGKKEEEISRAHAAIRARNEKLRLAEAQLQAQESQLVASTAEVRQLRLDLRSAVAEKKRLQEELEDSQKELRRQEGKLTAMESDLEKRGGIVTAAQKEIKILQKHLKNSGVKGEAASRELAQAKSMIGAVKAELKVSNEALSKFRSEVHELKSAVSRQEREATNASMLLKKRERELERANAELAKERATLQAVRAAVLDLETKLKHEMDACETLAMEVRDARSRLRTAMSEASELRKSVRQAESELSDAKITLQLKEAELVGLRLELQESASDLSIAKQDLKSRSEELDAAASALEGLRRELAAVKLELQVKDERVAASDKALEMREETIGAMEVKLEGSNARLAAAETVVEQIAELSRKLADSALAAGGFDMGVLTSGRAVQSGGVGSVGLRGGKMLVGESVLLAETNRELFAASRALLEKEHGMQLLQVGPTDLPDLLLHIHLIFPPQLSPPRSLPRTCFPSLLLSTSLSRAAPSARPPWPFRLPLPHFVSFLSIPWPTPHPKQEQEQEQREQNERLLEQLRAARAALGEKQIELDSVKSLLAEREEEIRQLTARWEEREAALTAMRAEVISGAREIAQLRDVIKSASSRQAGQQGEGVEKVSQADLVAHEVVKLELEVAKVEVETAMSALQGLADLSAQLKADTNDRPLLLPASSLGSSTASASQLHGSRPALASASAAVGVSGSAAQQGEEQEQQQRLQRQQEREERRQREEEQEEARMQQQLQERDNALRMAVRAMSNLTRLTQKLAADAQAELSGEEPVLQM